MITVDEPSLSVVIGINTSPLSGRDGSKLTARQVRARLDQELIGNVSIRVRDTERPDAWEVQGRGELQLAVLVELMRREGFELTVGQPHVVTREIDGKVHEPIERLTIDVPEDYVGVVTQLLALRKGRLEQMVNHGTGWVRMDYLVPARGLIGFRTEFLTETRGHRPAAPRLRPLGAVGGRPAHPADGRPGGGPLAARPPASRCSVCRSAARMFVEPGEDVYEGMIVGENSRADGPRRERGQGEAPDQHAVLDRRRARAARACRKAVAGPGARVPARGRVRRGDAAAVRLRKVELDKTARAKLARRSRAETAVT